MKYPIHIAFCVNSKYLEYVRVTVRSIIDSHESTDVTVHILSDNISDHTRRKFISEFSWAPFMHIQFHEVDDSPLDGLKAWSKYTWYRLLLPSVLPPDVHRVLYLDADTLVTDNLTDMFNTDLSDLAVAGVIDPMNFDLSAYERCGYEREKCYICAGVMLCNLDYWRQHNLQATMIAWGLENVDIKFHDQDCINYICRDCRKLLTLRYGVIDVLFTIDDLYMPTRIEEVQDALERPAIVHYAGKAPWLKDVQEHIFSYKWHDTNKKLRRRVRRGYRTTGWLKTKIMVYRMLHPAKVRQTIDTKTVKQKIIKAKMLQNV